MKPTANPKSSRWRATHWPYTGLIGAVTLLFFWTYFLLDQTLYAGDTAFVFVPFRRFLVRHFTSGTLPLWNPSIFGGMPALAEPTFQVFYPINWLMLALGTGRGMGWILAFHLAFMAVGTFAFLRDSLKVNRASALLGALAFAFGGFIQSRLSVPVYINAAAWLPWILWGYDQGRKRGGSWIVVAPIALTLQICTGGAQYTYYSIALLIGYHLFCLRQNGKETETGGGARAWGLLGFILVAGVALAAAQLLPEFELARLSNRGTAANYEFAISGSLAPRHFFFASFFPKFFGLYSSAPLDGFMAASESSYLGAAIFALLGAASATRSRSALWFWVAASLLSLSMAFGGNNPVYPFLFRYLPGTSTFRGPGNWLLITSFCGSILAALGLDALLETENRAARLRAFGAALGALLVALAILLTPVGAPAFQTAQAPYGPWGQVAVFAIVAILAGFVWAPPTRSLLTARRLAGIFLVILVFDLFAVSQDMELNHTVSSTDLETPPATIAVLKNASASAGLGERFWSENSATPLEPWQLGRPLTDDEAVSFRARQAMVVRSLMPSCVATEWSAPGLSGAWGGLMPMRRHAQPLYDAGTSPALRQRWLHLLNVRYHVSFGPALQGDWQTVSTDGPNVYRDPQALPRAFWVGQTVPATFENAVGLVNSANFDPRQQVVLEGSAPDAPATKAQDLTLAPISHYEDGFIEMDVNAPANGQLVLMDSFYPGWHARVDDQDTPILPANYVGRAIAVTAGNHKVRVWFEPQSVRLGIFLSLVTLSMLAGIGVQAFQARRKN